MFLLSGLAFVLKLLFVRKKTALSNTLFWLANLLAALLFGVSHLLPVMGIMDITTALVAYALVLNGVLGLSFGWFFRRYGLEAAMVAHFTVDLVLHVLNPLIMG